MTQVSFEAKREKMWSMLKELSNRGKKLIQLERIGYYTSSIAIGANGSAGVEYAVSRRNSDFCCGLSEVGGWGLPPDLYIEMFGHLIPEVEFTNSATITTLAPNQKKIADILTQRCGWKELKGFYNSNSGNTVMILGFFRDGRASIRSSIGIQHPSDVLCDRSLYEYRK